MGALPHPESPRNGFSLIEVLIAVAILGIVALGIVGLFSRSIVVNASGYDYAVLSAVARQALEELQGLPFTDAALDPSTNPHTWTDPTGSGRFTVTYNVSDYFIQSWADVAGAGPWPTPDPANPLEAANLKRITLGIDSTNVNLLGRREFVITALRAQ
jgi:prepilin-type N-terminal cleavage/methylation domain-containing protein